jgi:hypothetical protein
MKIKIAIARIRFINDISLYVSNFINFAGIEEIIGNGNTERLKFLNEFRSYSLGAEPSPHSTIGIDAGLFKSKYFLEGNRIAFHPGNLLKADNLSAAIHQT